MGNSRSLIHVPTEAFLLELHFEWLEVFGGGGRPSLPGGPGEEALLLPTPRGTWDLAPAAAWPRRASGLFCGN